ncbi:MAG: hypothetical protein L0K65_09375, partial [Actinomyces sp.]|nr:hypothetical protein [Actinomyces sp.]
MDAELLDPELRGPMTRVPALDVTNPLVRWAGSHLVGLLPSARLPAGMVRERLRVSPHAVVRVLPPPGGGSGGALLWIP